jgi:hypothetical protein
LGGSGKRKYHWLRWSEVCKPKDMGRLGIIHSRIMNITLMLKWTWHLLQPDESHNLFHKLLLAKYTNAQKILSSNNHGGLQFWQIINTIKNIVGAKFVIGNGLFVAFWTDWWLGEAPLATQFSRFFYISLDPELRWPMPFLLLAGM